MAVVVDTANVPPDDRFAVWSDVSAQVFEPLAVAQLGQGPFAARLEHYGLGAVGMYHMWADASSADRTPRLIRSGNPELVAERLERLAWTIGPERVVASTDCGFAPGPYLRRVHPTIQWAKLEALAEGARIASRDLGGKPAAAR